MKRLFLGSTLLLLILGAGTGGTFDTILTVPVTTAASAATSETEPDGELVAVIEPAPQPILNWLRLGPLPATLPAFHDAEKSGFKVQDLLDTPSLDRSSLQPRLGLETVFPGGLTVTWQEVDNTEELLDFGQPETATEVYLAVYLACDRWLSVDLRLRTGHSVKAFLDGKAVDLTKTELDNPADEPEDAVVTKATDNLETVPAFTGSLSLPIGKHLLLVHALFDPETEAPWQFAGDVTLGEDSDRSALTLTATPTRAVNIHDILDAPRIRDAVISPDGDLVAVTLTEYRNDRDESSTSWLELRQPNGDLVQSWRSGPSASQVQWAPTGQQLSYTTSDAGKTTIWLHDFETGFTKELLGGVEHFGGYGWAPDGSCLVYSFTVEAEPDEREVKRVKHPADRQPWWRNRSYLMQVALPDGGSRRLTAGPLSTTGWSFSPDSGRLLFFRSEPDILHRPYSTTELWELDLTTLETELILEDPWLNNAVYGPEPGTLAITGSPSAFDGLGLNLPEGVQPNDYGGQLFLYDRRSGEARAVSRDFAPAIGGLHWSQQDNRIYTTCTDGQYRRLYVYDPGKAEWSQVASGCEYVSGVDYARSSRYAVAYGTGITTPSTMNLLDLRRGSVRTVLVPGESWYQDITFGKTEMWPCELPDGGTLDGRIYYPRDFDPTRKYPVIVYYYGGTSPVTVDYGGRYPKNIWAGQDYAIYVPQPSGAIGYGQEFAARHVNDWGKLTAAEVIAGTEAFLAAHDWADPERVGCIGASYGGFLTMYLVSQTDIFAAAVSHAGISSISSYWGEGYWGYAYGARALTDAFPWSDRELYVEQSPLFNADQINTPLLLVHGAADTNVPLGESISLFTALKMLGREVEYIRIEGQDHWILDHDKRVLWNDTILAFFAKFLKDRPQWWEELYPDSAEQ
ncbi:MAG: S9 family peptidase [bacterium]